jgi:hypothetical protein
MSYLPNDRLESALAAVMTAAVAALNPLPKVYTGIGTDEKVLQSITCMADGDGEEDPKGTGNFWVMAKVQFRTRPYPDVTADPKGARQILLDAGLTALMDSTLPATLSAAVTNLTVFDNGIVYSAVKMGQDAKGAWVDELEMRCYCCGRGGL